MKYCAAYPYSQYCSVRDVQERDFAPSPLAGEGWDGGEKPGIEALPPLTPTLPRQGGGDSLGPWRRHIYRTLLPYSCAAVLTLVLSTLGLTVGCALIEPQVTPVNRDVYRVLPPPQQEVPPRYEGALFSGENGRNMFFVDRKARAVNDVLTVRIADVTRATGEANTNASRASSIAGNLDNVFGYKPGNVVEAQLKFGFDGKGTTMRKNALSATVTAVVHEVFPNGNLFVEGSKEVIINNERQYITVTGVVRPEDIAPDNSISSDLLADARLVYSGRGVLSDKQRPGLLGRIVDFVWPF